MYRFEAFSLFLLALLCSPSAYAYLDPGTGSIILQAIIGSIALGLATARMWWHRLTALLTGRKLDEEEDDDEDDEEEKA